MMTNLFSMFDPCNFFMNSNWIIPSILIFLPIFKNMSKFFTMNSKMINYMMMEMNTLTSSNLSNNFLMPMFLTTLLMNLISMIPSVFATTSHMSFIFPMTLSLWMMNIIYFSLSKMNNMLSHMVPMGSPFFLMPIMIMIEIMSNLMRPLTLTIRLMANITAGHLLMHLLSSFSCSMFNSPFLLMLIPFSIILNILELMVSLIQSYILCTLIALYSNEIN